MLSKLYFALMLLVSTFGLSLAASASAPPDPWGDAVYSTSGTGVTNPDNILGPPDGQVTNNVGLQKFITVDMGEGEEGTGSLRVYFGQLLVQTDIQVVFLDDALNPITSASRSLKIATSTHSEVFNYSYSTFNKAYRYVRINSLAELGFSIDAIEALSYNTVTPPVTPPPATCQNDTWTCGEWSSCSSSGQETRSCVVSNDCSNVATPSPATSRDCIPPSSSSTPPPSSSPQSQSYYYYYSNTQTAPPASGSTPSPTPAPTPAPSAPSTPSTPPKTSGSSDVTGPVISNIQTAPLDPNTEKITWTTDEPSDSGVEYGPENGVQRFTPPDMELTKDHVVWLSDLAPGTNYLFRVYSRDAVGNQTRSPEGIFTTLGQAMAGSLTSLAFVTTCGWMNVLLFLLLALVTAIAIHWHNQARRLQKKSQKKTS